MSNEKMFIYKVVCARCSKPLGTIINGTEVYPFLLPMSFYNREPLCRMSLYADDEGVDMYCPDCYLEGVPYESNN